MATQEYNQNYHFFYQKYLLYGHFDVKRKIMMCLLMTYLARDKIGEGIPRLGK
jgi:hypothetical protein